jgi:CBS domain-containing protein
LHITTPPRLVEELRNQPIDSFISRLVEASANSSLSKVIGLLKERGVYEVFLPERDRCAIISTRDVLKAASFETTKPSTLISYVPVLRNGTLVGEVARLMADYRIRAVPISDGANIIGQANSSTLLERLKGRIGGELRIASIATKNPIHVDTETSTAKARELMLRKRIDHLPVFQEGRLAGILTSSHIVSRMVPPERLGSKSMKAETRSSLDFLVGDAMQPSPLTCAPDATVEKALGSLLESGQTCILVTQWEELQGIVTPRDFMTLLALPDPETDIPVFMVGLPEDPFEAEAAKAKFKRTVNQLHRVFPDILEARSVIKSKFTKPGKERGRYEVTVHIRTSKNTYTYSDGGWDLPVVYDLITDRIKRLLTQKHVRRRSRERERSETD